MDFRLRGGRWALLLGATSWGHQVNAATLPEHDPIDILIVSDGVNPHGLSPEELTEPGDLSAAFEASDSGITVGTVDEVSSQCVDDALLWLSSSDPPDVLVYFAHQAATLCAGDSAQADLFVLTEGLLAGGRGVLVFHHGIYQAAGKEEMLGLLGGEANSIAWEEEDGQDVVNVAADHFVTTHEVGYPLNRSLPEISGVSAGDYPAFNNTPDERYPATTLITADGETRTILFATASGTPRVLGYDLQPPGLSGHVIVYQPGEYQPLILDDRDGPDFQILANALLYLSGQPLTGQPPDGSGGASSGGAGDGGPGDGGTNAGGTSTAESGGDSALGGDSSTSGGAPALGGASGGDGNPSGGSGGGSPIDPAAGCSCRTAKSGDLPGSNAWGWMIGVGIWAMRRWRRGAPLLG